MTGLVKFVLPFIGVATLYTAFYFAYMNGTHKLGWEYIDSGKLPGRNDPIRTVYTEIPSIDRFLTILTIFFWPMTDGSNPTLAWHSIGFSGCFCSSWVLITLESWRRGNKWTIVAFSFIFGISAQVLTVGFTVPVYGALQLIFSATAARPNAENTRVPRAVLNFIPFAFVIGNIVPSLLMIAPLSETITTDFKQILIAIWQPWPIYISVLTSVASLLFSPFVSNDNNVEGGRATLRALRKVYASAFGNAVLSHQIQVILPLLTVLEPRFFNEKFLAALHPAAVFATPLPWAQPTLQVPDFGTGIHYFLRWDYVGETIGVLLWTLTLHRNAHRAILGKAGCLGLLVKVVLLTVFAGPAGAAVELMWERDELVIHETGGLKQRVSKDKKSS